MLIIKTNVSALFKKSILKNPNFYFYRYFIFSVICTLCPTYHANEQYSFYLFLFSCPCNGSESIVFGSNFRNADIDGFTHFDIP